MKRNIFKAFPAIAMMLLLASCSDFFDQESDHVIYADKGHLGNATDTIYSVTGIMNKMQVISDRTILLGEVRGDLMDINDYTPADLRDVARFDIGDNNAYNSPRDYYAVINNCNYFIANADTALKNNRNEYIFMREYAAVKAFRAWTYLQLVLNYGQVPFVTDPILSNADANKDYPMKGIQEVCDYFISDIEKYATIETPRYGSIRSNDSRFFYFPIYILLGDLNLWAGHYKEAALNYYRYLSTRNGTNSSYPITTNRVSWSANDSHWRNTSDSWSRNSFSNETYVDNAELITMIPGDSIPSEGNYSELRNIFNGLNNEDHAMLKPSQYIFDLSAAQPYCYLTGSNDVVYAPQGLDDFQTGDLRLSSVYNKYRVSGSGNVIIISRNYNEDNYYISKYATRNVHIYRRTMVYLRMAEALNRAGYPRFAFEILKNGVNNRQIENEVIPYYTADSTWIRQFDFPNNDYILQSRGNLTTENTMGIHSHGSGWTSFNDYYVLPDDTLITDSLMRRDYQIEKVEDLIMDEEALEFAFEGYRFYDLMRVALRRNDPSYLANHVYMRRGANKVDEVKAFIGRDLTDTRNWYLNWNDQIGLGY